jgi:hypothetical protein
VGRTEVIHKEIKQNLAWVERFIMAVITIMTSVFLKVSTLLLHLYPLAILDFEKIMFHQDFA